MQTLSLLRLRRAALVLAALAAYGTASATDLTYNFTVAQSQPNTTSSTLSSAVPLFNPSLGVLQSVTFGLTDTMTSTISIQNTSPNAAQHLKVVITGNFSLASADGTSSYVVGDALNITKEDDFAAKPAGTTGNYQSPYGASYAPVTVAASKTASSTASAVLSKFIGTTSTNFLLNASAVRTVDLPGNASGFYLTNVSGSGFVTYSYAPVPEPTSIAALGLGVCALIRRRKAGAR